MKKLTALLLTIAMALSLAACNGGGGGSSSAKGNTSTPGSGASSSVPKDDRPYYVRDASEVTGKITIYTTIGETEQDALKSLWTKYYPD